MKTKAYYIILIFVICILWQSTWAQKPFPVVDASQVLDLSFGKQGIFVAPFPNNHQEDWWEMAAYSSEVSGAVTRYGYGLSLRVLPTGTSLDPQFGSAGILESDYLQPNTIHLSGTKTINLVALPQESFLGLLNNGSPDTSLGPNGLRQVPVEANPESHIVASPAGPFYLYTYADPGAGIVRFLSGGNIDGTFANQGVFSQGQDGGISDLLATADGGVLYLSNYIKKVDATGHLDLNFHPLFSNSAGNYFRHFGPLSSKGGFYAVSVLAIHRYNSDGTPDSSFVKKGIATPGPEENYDVQELDDGTIAVVTMMSYGDLVVDEYDHSGKQTLETFLKLPGKNGPWSASYDTISKPKAFKRDGKLMIGFNYHSTLNLSETGWGVFAFK